MPTTGPPNGLRSWNDSGMYANQAANALISTLGTPLHAELINTKHYPLCLQACILVDASFHYPQSITFVIDEGLKEIAGELKVAYRSKAPRCLSQLSQLSQVWTPS